ncbi:MAG: hypothetical protein E4G96_10575 [Chrysiogenales bacterium]|nr:MAG: hypothetical protein E4G96_10575 [Chrysiogenales bacterium]
MTATRQEFNEHEIRALEPTEKIALVATINPEGLPHISLLTSLQAIAPAKMVLGEFSRGLSKEFMQRNDRVGFLIMTLDRALWRGAARWTHSLKEGPEYRMMNEKPMFRYNAYFGVNTVHYFDLVRTTERQGLPMAGIALAMMKTAFARGGMRRQIGPILKPFALSLVDRIGSLKFLSYIGEDGFPVLVPLLHCRAADSGRLAFVMSPYADELAAVPKGSTVAVFAMTMKMEDILIRGVYNGPRRSRGISLGTIDITWAYNSMPPVHGQIYPETEHFPVANF